MPVKIGLLTIMLVVDNEFGVLTRITALIRREGGNIKSLVAAETAQPSLSHLVIRIECLQGYADTILHRIGRMDCVHKLDVYQPDAYLMRELAVVSLAHDEPAVAQIADEFGARRIPEEGGVAYELVALPETIDRFMAQVEGVCAAATARTGAIAVQRRTLCDQEDAQPCH